MKNKIKNTPYNIVTIEDTENRTQTSQQWWWHGRISPIAEIN